MHIEIIVVGRLKNQFKYLQIGVDEYIKRLKPYAKISIVEVADETISPSLTEEQVKDREGERILPHMERSAYAIALSERGDSLNSEAFAKALSQRAFHDSPARNQPNSGFRKPGNPPMIVIVGGALGLSQEVLQRADWVVSLSPMTFPHPLVRLILMEQLYRAFRILNNEPYHK